jgi:hypothetical protein
VGLVSGGLKHVWNSLIWRMELYVDNLNK